MAKGVRVFDAHVHMDLGTDVDRLVEAARKLRCRLGISSCGLMFHQPDNDAVAAALQKYPDDIVGFGYVALGRGDGPPKVVELHRQGFRALKVICPTKPYDDKSFYPIYAKAEELRMPILFHTGVVARTDLWASRPGYEAMKAIDFRKLDISSDHMRPICVDAIARAFPGLNIIMAHFLSLGRRDEAAALLVSHPNVYADLTTPSGATTKKRVKEYVKLLRGMIPTPPYEKFIFGTDFFTSHGTDRLKSGIKAIHSFLDELKVSKKVRDGVMYATAERLVGIG